jgi:hypothetical protein
MTATIPDRPPLACDDAARRALLLAHPTGNGIDFVEVPAESLDKVPAQSLDAQRFIRVHFIKQPPPASLAGHPELFAVDGGVRVRGLRVLHVTPEAGHLIVEVDRPGDFSTYTLRVTGGGLDPAYAAVDFSFKAGCPSRFDCKPPPCPPAPLPSGPPVDYLAKDYASFRQALLDLVPTLVPGWVERHEADLGIALVELMAYLGDQLSYFQDAVATEAYLETARQRISVRRHACLIDYRMHDGASARTLVQFDVDKPGRVPAGTRILTRIDLPLGPRMPPHDTLLPQGLEQLAVTTAGTVFETIEETPVHPSLSGALRIHTWRDRRCCLPAGATSADLVGKLTPQLAEGTLLLLEEALGPVTGRPEDADPAHRQVVRLTAVADTSDPLLPDPATGRPLPLTRVTWDAADALDFPLCMSTRLPDGRDLEDVSVALANLVLADHGRSVTERHPDDPRAPGIRTSSRAFGFFLGQGPLSFRVPPPSQGADGGLPPARELLRTDPRLARPEVRELTITPAPLPPAAPAPPGASWRPAAGAGAADLLASGPFDQRFAVETGNDGRALLRFGDDVFGMAPPDGGHIRVTYRLGVGTAGNVGAGSLAHVIDSPGLPAVRAVCNPLPAWGGTNPEPEAVVKQLAPAAFRAEQRRAVTADDYARVAERHPEVDRAVATFRWTGSWHAVFVSIDPRGRTGVPPDLERRVRAFVAGFAQAGHDLEIDPPVYVPVALEADVCLLPGYLAGDVEQVILAELGTGDLPGGRRGLFHPDAFTFGQPLYASQVYARIDAVEGVDSVVLTRFARQHEPDPDPDRPATADHLAEGRITVDRLEVIRLDNDPNSPEQGTLELRVGGGR